ncbi:hypothetical protein [Burkholderia cepacia]|uniref:hypothetical protein n=1 Tax=Burkholderia cepacia TaxID=292 RepID=UPI00158D7F2E|nr:hypothetical protein [Burkholderia cepacia]
MADYRELLEQKRVLEEKIQEQLKIEREAILDAILEKMTDYNISLSDIEKASKRKTRKKK